jgi:hypothetical protein
MSERLFGKDEEHESAKERGIIRTWTQIKTDQRKNQTTSAFICDICG